MHFKEAMSQTNYQPPVSALLTYGSCFDVDKEVSHPENELLREKIIASAATGKVSPDLLAQLKPTLTPDKWPNYLEELGITSEHVSELIQMATDESLSHADGESTEVWAPTHAWRCLGFLQAAEAIEPLIGLLKNEYDDWASEEIPWVLGLIGGRAIAPTAKILASRGKEERCRTTAASSLENIAILHPGLRDRCIDRLASQLADYEHNSEYVNGFVVSSLVELKATSKANLMERAFANERVDESILGNWAHAQIAMGMAKEEDFDPEELENNFEWVREEPKRVRRTTDIGLGLPIKSAKRKQSSTSKAGKDRASRPVKGFGGNNARKPNQKQSKKK